MRSVVRGEMDGNVLEREEGDSRQEPRRGAKSTCVAARSQLAATPEHDQQRVAQRFHQRQLKVNSRVHVSTVATRRFTHSASHITRPPAYELPCIQSDAVPSRK